MLKTILLLDGSEAMNSASDYLPSYLLAMRAPLLSFVSQYLDATPLASLGVVVMRNGVADRLCPCTTNASELVDTLERDYLLYGGSGVTSLENGLRMALSELVDLKKIASLPKRDGAGAVTASVHQQIGVAQLRVVVVSASVTFIDPTDVFRVIATMAAFRVKIDVVSLTGAVHVFDECARQTGGHLYCPMNYDHLLSTTHSLAVGRAGKEGGPKRRQRRTNDHGASSNADKAPMVPVGFPVYVTRGASAGETHYLACPQCHFIQTSIPSTCPLCKLLLCNVSLTYATFVSHNALTPTTTAVETRRLLALREAKPESARREEGVRCSVCNVHCANPREGGTFHMCHGCHTARCASCDLFVKETLGLCPGCVAAK